MESSIFLFFYLIRCLFEKSLSMSLFCWSPHRFRHKPRYTLQKHTCNNGGGERGRVLSFLTICLSFLSPPPRAYKQPTSTPFTSLALQPQDTSSKKTRITPSPPLLPTHSKHTPLSYSCSGTIFSVLSSLRSLLLPILTLLPLHIHTHSHTAGPLLLQTKHAHTHTKKRRKN